MNAPNNPNAKSRPMGWLVLPLRLILAALFAFAAYVKIVDPRLFAQSVEAFKILPEHLVVTMTFVIPWTEMFVAACLVLGLWTRAAALVLTGLLAVFVVGIVSVLYRGMDVKCGCFGKYEIPCSGALGICHIIRNGVLMLMSLLVVIFGPGPLAIDRPSSR